jgi:hypothetical protein
VICSSVAAIPAYLLSIAAMNRQYALLLFSKKENICSSSSKVRNPANLLLGGLERKLEPANAPESLLQVLQPAKICGVTSILWGRKRSRRVATNLLHLLQITERSDARRKRLRSCRSRGDTPNARCKANLLRHRASSRHYEAGPVHIAASCAC